MADSPLVACRHCATLHERVPIEPGALASCTRCGYALYRNSRVTPDGWIAIAVATLIVFAIANYFPIARLNIQGLSIQDSLPRSEERRVGKGWFRTFGFGWLSVH